MKTFAKLCRVSVGVLCMGASAGWSQIKITTPDCSITFGSGWALTDTVQTALTKDDGVSGLALFRSRREAVPAPFDAAAEAKAVADSLEAHITVTKEETKILGAYSVKILSMSYDELVRLEREAAARGRDVTLKNGTLKLYLIQSGGVRVAIIGVYAVALLTPFASIEQAIPSLAMSQSNGISAFDRPAAPAWSVTGGKLRFQGKRPSAVSALDGRGRLVAWLHGENGPAGASWDLPSGMGPVILSARYENGPPSPLGWWRGEP